MLRVSKYAELASIPFQSRTAQIGRVTDTLFKALMADCSLRASGWSGSVGLPGRTVARGRAITTLNSSITAVTDSQICCDMAPTPGDPPPDLALTPALTPT
jgi:hypothetical protein